MSGWLRTYSGHTERCTQRSRGGADTVRTTKIVRHWCLPRSGFSARIGLNLPGGCPKTARPRPRGHPPLVPDRSQRTEPPGRLGKLQKGSRPPDGANVRGPRVRSQIVGASNPGAFRTPEPSREGYFMRSGIVPAPDGPAKGGVRAPRRQLRRLGWPAMPTGSKGGSA